MTPRQVARLVETYLLKNLDSEDASITIRSERGELTITTNETLRETLAGVADPAAVVG